MTIWEVVVLGIGLSMDAFAVALCKGLAMKKFRIQTGLLIALFFGGFQALMPLAGWFLGSRFSGYIEAVDHWIAFGLLLIIGGKMFLDGIREIRHPEPEQEEYDSLKICLFLP